MSQQVRSYFAPAGEEDLDKIFSTSDQEVDTFVDTLSDVIESEGGMHYQADTMRKIISGKPDKVKTPPPLSEYISGFIRIFCGWHNSDFVWHIEPAAIRKPWKTKESRIVYIIASIMIDHLPADIKAKMFFPEAEWENRSITFKAQDIGDCWSFDQSLVEKINQRLFEVLNQYV